MTARHLITRNTCLYLRWPITHLTDLITYHVNYEVAVTIGKRICEGCVCKPSKKIFVLQFVLEDCGTVVKRRLLVSIVSANTNGTITGYVYRKQTLSEINVSLKLASQSMYIGLNKFHKTKKKYVHNANLILFRWTV